MPESDDILPDQIVDDILGWVRKQFYSDLPPKRWFQDQQFIKRMVVLWPAHWLHERGVTLQPKRFRGLILSILIDIARNGDTGHVGYWPRYLAHCIQEHFRHHGDKIYSEAKSLRSAIERAVLVAETSVSRTPDPVATLSKAWEISRSGSRPSRKKPCVSQAFLPL